MLQLKNLTKRYKKQVVFEDVNHVFETGVTVITGPSGVGKTTLLRLCATAEKPSRGDILWQNKSVQKHKRDFRNILGYAPQQISFPEDLSALDFMRHIGALKGLSYKESTQQALSLFSRLGLADDADKIIQAYSGGMRRRLGLAQAFLGAPQCLVIDEPTAELDPQTAEIIHALIFEKAKTATILMTTHLEAGLKAYPYQSFKMTKAS